MDGPVDIPIRNKGKFVPMMRLDLAKEGNPSILHGSSVIPAATKVR